MSNNSEIVLECREISHWFKDKHILHDINLKVIRGEIVSLVGPSGCGKSTLLRAVIGTHPPCAGSVIVTKFGKKTGTVVKGPNRDRGIVYQQYSLFPFLTAQQNVALGPMLDGTTLPYRTFKMLRWRKQYKKLLEESAALLEKLKLGDALKHYPTEMSGGMCQRVAIAQALIMKPEILLLDEPFGALDEATREELQIMLLELYEENCEAKKTGGQPPYTILIVTHELDEAIYVGDRVVGLSQYWDWKGENFETFPGATIVLDKVAPVYKPDDIRNFESFTELRSTIRKAAFDPHFLHPRQQFQNFWDELKAGKGMGILA